MFSKFFKKKIKELKDIITIDYDENYIFLHINIEELSQDTQIFFDLIVDELTDENLIEYNQNTIQVPHQNIYEAQEILSRLIDIKNFDGSLEVILKGIVSQDNAKFILNLFDTNYNQIAPYKVYGSILEITKTTFYLLPKNIFEIFQAKKYIKDNFHKYKFIELVQNDTSNKVKFVGLMKNDKIKTVENKNMGLNIQEDDKHNLILSPKIDELDENKIEKYKEHIEHAQDNLLLTDVDDGKITRYLLDENQLKIAKAINNNSFVPKEKAGLFMVNPSSHFENETEEIKDILIENIFDKGFRIIGIGEPYIGYFGSVKTNTPLSDVLKVDNSFKIAVDNNELNEFIQKHKDSLEDIKTQIQTAKENDLDKITIDDTNIFKPSFDTYLSKIEQTISKKNVLVIEPNDEIDIDIQIQTDKNLQNISTNNTTKRDNYVDFAFIPLKHQVIALNWMIDLYNNNYKGCLLADDMGLGKTFEVISFLNFLKQKKQKCKFLIVAPTVLIENWQNEFIKSLKNSDYKIKIVRGKNTALDKLNHLTIGDINLDKIVKDLDVINFLENYDVYITTYKTLVKYQFAWVSEVMHLDCIVYDEAQNIKNPNTLQTQASKAISSGDNLFSVLMTGTPIENELRDLWSLFDTFDPAFFGSWKYFRKEYISNNQDVEKRLREKISNYMLRRMKNDILDGLPKKYELKKEIFFTKNETTKYFEILQSDTKSLSKLYNLKLYSMHPVLLQKEKLKDITNLVQDDILESFSKTNELLEILKNIKTKDEKVIIFTISKTMQIILQYNLKKFFNLDELYIINGDNNKAKTMTIKLNNFRNKQGFNIIILSPLAVGVGLTLVEANHVIHFERHYNPAKENQASDRVYRIGQKKDVFIYYLIFKFLDDKKLTFDKGLDILIENKKALSDNTLISINNEINKTELLEKIK